MTHSDISKCQQTEKREEVRESVFLQTCPQGDVNVWMKPPLPSLIPLKRQRWGKNPPQQQTCQQEAIPSWEQRSEQPCCQWSWEPQQHSLITLLSHRGVMGAGMERNHTRVTEAVTRARCAFKYESTHLYIHALTQRQRRLWYLKNVSWNGKKAPFFCHMCY